MSTMISSCVFFAMIAGGISQQSAVEWVSVWEDEEVANAAIMHRPMAKEQLVRLSKRWYVGEQTLFFLLRHPNFPQEERSELIRKGKGTFYITNIRPGYFTEADINAYLDYSSGWTFFRPEGLYRILQTPGMSDDTYRRAWRNFTERYERTEIYGWFIPRFLVRKNEIRQCEPYLNVLKKMDFLPSDVRNAINKQLQLIGASGE